MVPGSINVQIIKAGLRFYAPLSKINQLGNQQSYHRDYLYLYHNGQSTMEEHYEYYLRNSQEAGNHNRFILVQRQKVISKDVRYRKQGSS